MSGQTKKKLIKTLILNGMAKQAFSLAAAYGSEGIDPKLLVRMCSRMVLNLEFQETEMLAAQCISCVKQGKYDENVLAYLLAYYDGQMETTIKLLESRKDLWTGNLPPGRKDYADGYYLQMQPVREPRRFSNLTGKILESSIF